MNGVHDMGGMAGYGAVPRERDEPVFHAPWESRVLGLVRNTVDVHYNWDEFRYAIERVDPVVYLSVSYYERWLTALERFLVEKEVVTPDELRAGSGQEVPRAGTAPVRAAAPAPAVASAPRFAIGAAVRARNINPTGHTRLPRYARGKAGVIERLLGRMVLADANSLQAGEILQPVYAVRFTARELWGPEASARDSVCIDLWEDYLEAV